MSYLGDYAEDYATLNFKFTSRQFSTGAPYTLAGTPVVKCYKGSATGTESTAGITLTADFDSVTGLNNVLIDLSADAFYEVGQDYHVIITTGTVDSVSVVGEEVATFSIENRWNNIDGIGAGSSGAVNIKATEDNSSAAIIDGITKVGTITGDFNNVHADTAGTTIISITDTGNDIDFVLGYDVGGARTATSASIVANVNGNTDSMTIEAYDHVGAGWDIIGILNGSGGGSYVTKDYPLYAEHTGTGSELGKVYIRFDNNATTPSLLQIDRCSVAAVSSSTSVGYADGAYWVDSAGTAGTEIGTNGTADNPCTWANAVSMNATQSLNRFHVANGNSVTLSANSDAYTMMGEAWALALGSQSIDGMSIHGATITGIGEATTTGPSFYDCQFGAGTYPAGKYTRCGIGVSDGLFTAANAGDYTFIRCYSVVAGSGSPDFTFAGLGSTTGINNRAWNGGAAFTLDSNCTLSHEVEQGGGTTINVNGGAAEIRGIMRALTLAMTGTETVQFVGIVGPVALSGTTTATVKLYGAVGVVTDTTSGATVTLESTLRPTVGGRTLDLTAGGAAGIDWGNVENKTTANDLTQTGIQLCDTVTTNADMRGTDSAATEAKQDTMQTAVTAVKTITDLIGAVAAAKLALTMGTAGAPTGAAEAGTLTTTAMTTDLTEATDDHYINRSVVWLTGVLAGQGRVITDYTGATGMLTYAAITEAPSAADTFVIL